MGLNLIVMGIEFWVKSFLKIKIDEFFWEFNPQSRWSEMRRNCNFANFGAKMLIGGGTAENIIVSTRNAFDKFGEEIIMISVDKKLYFFKKYSTIIVY